MAINYKRTNWVDEVTPLDADNMNNIEDAIVALSSMKIPSNFSDGTGKGSVVQIGNVANGESSAAFGVGNTATSLAQLVGGMYSKVGENGIAGMQNDSSLLVRIGYGTEGNEKTAFSIGLDGTTCMRRGAVVTGSISEDYHIINRRYADSRYLQKSGGTVSGNVTVQGDLTVTGTTTTETEKQLLVEANVIATNANKQPLGALLSGLAINKNANDTYGLMYDPTDDTVKFGQGTLDTNSKFIFSENEGRPIAIRDDSDKFTDGHFVKWQASSNSFVDAGVDEKTIQPTIGSIGGGQNALSSIIYTPESSIPTNAIEGVEYACTDLIGEGDLDDDLQTKINSALTQTTADERYVQKGTYTDTILTDSAGTVLVMAEGEAVLRLPIYTSSPVGPPLDTSTGLYKAYSNSGEAYTTTASHLAVNDKFFVMPWYTYTAAGPDGTTTYWETPLYYQVMEITEQTVDSNKQYLVRVIMHYANKAQ